MLAAKVPRETKLQGSCDQPVFFRVHGSVQSGRSLMDPYAEHVPTGHIVVSRAPVIRLVK